MSATTEPCYDCGRDVTDGAGETVRACVWSLPGAGQHWAWLPVCAECAARRRHWHAATVATVALLLAVLAALVAYPFLP